MPDTYDPLWWLQDQWGRDPGDADYGKPPKTDKPVVPVDTTTPPASTTTPPSSGGGGGGGGGGAAPGLSEYIQEYRLRFHPGGNPPADLLKKAKAGNWSIAYFDQQVRLRDPSYFKSLEAKQLLPAFNRTMKVLFPGLSDKTKQAGLMKSALYRQTAKWYLRNGVGLMEGGGAELLYSRITGTKAWNRQNPYWKMYQRNANAAVQAEANPMLYKSYLDVLKTSFSQVGLDKIPDDYYKTFFKSRYASQEGLAEFGQNLKNYAQQGASQAWFQGTPMSSGQVKSATLGEGKQANDLRSRLARSFSVRSSFLGSEEGTAGTSLSQQNKLVRPTL